MPDDTADLPAATKAIYVGSGGDVPLQLVGSDGEVVFSNVPTGTVLAVRVAAVRQTGTSAANLVGLA